MSDVFKKEYPALNDGDYIEIVQFKEKAEQLYNLMVMKQSREFSLAKTKLEECVMWFVKGISTK